jgi:YVTN family beta-propeller protein
VGLKPEHLAATPDGTHVYVANINSGTVSVIRTGTNTVVATVPVGNNPIGVAVTPDGKHAYVAIDSSNTVSVIRTATNTVVANIPVGRFSWSGHWAIMPLTFSDLGRGQQVLSCFSFKPDRP